MERQKFRRLADSDGEDQVTEIDDPYSLMSTQENKLVDYSSVDEADESSDSDIDIVQKTKQHKIDPLAFISLGKRQAPPLARTNPEADRQQTVKR